MDAVLTSLPLSLVEKFSELGVCYERKLAKHNGLGRTWTETFESDDPGIVETILLEQDVTFDWYDNYEYLYIQHKALGTLPATTTHGPVWFNQADQWHPSSLSSEIFTFLNSGKETVFPHNCFLGDGKPISSEEIKLIRQALVDNSAILPLGKGDLLILDNCWIGHGRQHFSGPRKMLVAMTDPKTTVT